MSYQRGLVKKIEVVSMKEEFDYNKPHIRIVDIGKDNSKRFYTKVECFVKRVKCHNNNIYICISTKVFNLIRFFTIIFITITYYI